MAKTLIGKVISVKMHNTAVVEVSWKAPHRLYKKLILKSKKLKVDTEGSNVTVGDSVKITETKPISKDKYFKVLKIYSTKEIPSDKETSSKKEAKKETKKK